MSEDDKQPIFVWWFGDAPAHLQERSTNGGDEDWLAEIPPGFGGARGVGWMWEGGNFGCCSVDEFDHPDKPGWKIAIGSHA